MKSLSSNRLLHRSFLSTCVFASSIAALLISQSAQGADVVWDSSTTAGYQNAGGTWGTDNFWVDRTLSGTTLQAWNPADTAWFGGNATTAASPSGNFTIALSGTQSAAAIRQIQNGAGDFTLSGGALTLTNAGGIRADRGTFTVNSAVSTSIGINVAAQATSSIVLGGSNTINGPIALTGIGAVKLTNASAFGQTSGSALVTAGVTGGTASLDINGLTISGRTFRANNGFSASLLSSSTSSDASWAGDVQLGSTAAFSGNVAAGATGAGRSLTLSGNISGGSGGTGILSTLANSRLILTGTSNTSTAGTTVAAASTLTVGNNTATGSLGSGGVSLTAADSALVINRNNAITVANVISGAGTVTATNSTGAVTLSVANTYTGGTTISAGTLTVGIASTRSGTTITNGATGTGNVTLGGGVTLAATLHTWYAPQVTLQGDITLTGNNRQSVGFRTLDLAGGTRTLYVNPTGGTLKQTITGNTALEGTGRSRWEMQNDVGAMTVQNGNLVLATDLTGNDYAGFMFRHATSFSGNAGVTVGTNVHLQTGDTGSLGSTTANSAKLTVNGIWNLFGTLGGTAGQGNQTIYSLAGSGKVYASMISANVNGRTITINGTGGSTDFFGELSDGPGTGKLSISKTGTSTQILSGTNTYTGDTTVTAGTLQLDGSTHVNSTVHVGTSATLSGIGTVNGNATLTGNGVIDKASGSIGGTLAVTGGSWNGQGSVTGAVTSERGIFTIHTGANLTATSGLTVTGGTLTGPGSITGATSIGNNATHNAGGIGSVGSQAIAGALDYGAGSIFGWDLNANSTASGFDIVSATGNISVGENTVFNVIFGGSVDLNDAFWSTPFTTQTWSMSSIFGKAFSTGSFASVTSTANATTQGSFTITNSGTTLAWTAVPEPTSAITGFLLGVGLLRRRRN